MTALDPTLSFRDFQLLKLNYDKLLLNFAVKCALRHYGTGQLLPIEESHVAGAVGAAEKQVFSPDMMAWEIQDEELSDRKEIGAGAFGMVMRTR